MKITTSVESELGEVRQSKFGPVTQNWTHELPFMQQSVLLSAIRGCDGIPKHHKSKALVRWYRRCVLISAFDKKILTNPCENGGGSFTGPIKVIENPLSEELYKEEEQKLLQKAADDFVDSRDELHAHYQTHMMHAFEVLGYKHPTPWVRDSWNNIYCRMANAYHLWPETEEQMDSRLGDEIEGWVERSDGSSVCTD